MELSREKDVKKALREMAEEVRKNLHPLTDPTSAFMTRKNIVEGMIKDPTFLRGFMRALTIIYGEERAHHFLQYYFQARSKKGVVNEPEM